MIIRALIAAACLVPHAAFAAPAQKDAAALDALPALGKLVESGAEKDYRFRTYLVGKKPSSTGAITIFMGQIHMRVQDISGGKQGRPSVRKWSYAARCSGDRCRPALTDGSSRVRCTRAWARRGLSSVFRPESSRHARLATGMT